MRSMRSVSRLGADGLVTLVLCLGLVLMISATSSMAAVSGRIATRPLTPQEIVDAGLPANTQKANGTHVVGVGQPVYLDLLLDLDAGVTVTQIVWKIVRVRGV